MTETVLLILACLFMAVGIIGCIVPVLPGMPLAYIGLLLAQATERVDFSTQTLVIWGIITVVVQVMDFVIAAWGTKRFGGTKYGAWGSTIGMLVGMLFGAWGVILGPFIGASLLEAVHSGDISKALTAGWGSCLGMLIATVIKVTCSVWMAVELIEAIL